MDGKGSMRSPDLGIDIDTMHGSTEHPSITGCTYADELGKWLASHGRPLLVARSGSSMRTAATWHSVRRVRSSHAARIVSSASNRCDQPTPDPRPEAEVPADLSATPLAVPPEPGQVNAAARAAICAKRNACATPAFGWTLSKP